MMWLYDFKQDKNMSTFNGGSSSSACSRRLCRLAVLAVAMLMPTIANAGYDPADVRTTTRFTPPTELGMASDGRMWADDPLIGLEVVKVRITWDVVVAEGFDAADIYADVVLPINTKSGAGAGIALSGPALKWSGSGLQQHYEETDRYNGFFAEGGFGWTAVPGGAAVVLPISRIEIDYLVPEPSCAVLLAISGLAILRRRRRR